MTLNPLARPTHCRPLLLLPVVVAALLIPSSPAWAEGRLRVELLFKGLECLETTSGMGDDSIYITTAALNLASGKVFVDDHLFFSVESDKFYPQQERLQGFGGFWPVKAIDDLVIFALVTEKDLGSGVQHTETSAEIDRRLTELIPKLKHQYTWQNRPRDQVVGEIRDVINQAWIDREKKQDDLIAITELRLMPEDVSTTQIKKKLKRHPAIGDGGAFALHVQVTSGPFEHGSPSDDKKNGAAGGTWQASPGQSGGGQKVPGGSQPNPGGAADSRSHWVHSDGSFRAVGGNQWNEYDAQGAIKFRYVETQRNPQYIELYDASREGFARLYANKAMGKHPLLSGNQWIDVLYGGWKGSPPGQAGNTPQKRVRWDYSGGYVYHVSGDEWRERQGGKLHATFTEQERTAEYIQLYNAQASLWVRLTDDAMHLFNGHHRDAGWQEYRGGKWTQ